MLARSIKRRKFKPPPPYDCLLRLTQGDAYIDLDIHGIKWAAHSNRDRDFPGKCNVCARGLVFDQPWFSMMHISWKWKMNLCCSCLCERISGFHTEDVVLYPMPMSHWFEPDFEVSSDMFDSKFSMVP